MFIEMGKNKHSMNITENIFELTGKHLQSSKAKKSFTISDEILSKHIF